MTHKLNTASHRRRGAIMVLAAFLMTALVGLIAFSVDYGYLLKVRTDLQRSADASALAAVQDLIRKPDGTQDLNKARETARAYVRDNLADSSFQVATADIEIGRYDPQTVYTNLTLLNTGTFDTVRVILRRDGATNPNVPLFFARLLGAQSATVTARATAILQKGEYMGPGVEILPFATPLDLWNSLSPGDEWTAYGDGKLKDGSGNDVPGNWGTCDVGDTNNSSSELNNQILNGLRQQDLNALKADGRISQTDYIDSSQPMWTQGDTGLSSGLKQSVTTVYGKQKLIPIYDQLANPTGSHVDFHVVGWGVVTVVDSEWHGFTNTYVRVRKSHWFEGKLRPKGSLSATSGYIEGGYTSPILVE